MFGAFNAQDHVTLPFYQQEHLTIEEGEVLSRLLPKLREQVFHVTSRDRFLSIENAGIVNANIDGIFGNTYHRSAKSFARRYGLVCLFDLRNRSENAIRAELRKFDNLAPLQLGDDLVFLMLSSESHPRIMLWGDAQCPEDYREYCGQRIPHIECWYPGDMPLSEINRVLFVHVNRSVPPLGSHSARMAAAHEDLWGDRPQEIEGKL